MTEPLALNEGMPRFHNYLYSTPLSLSTLTYYAFATAASVFSCTVSLSPRIRLRTVVLATFPRVRRDTSVALSPRVSMMVLMVFGEYTSHANIYLLTLSFLRASLIL
jgi:hypothetical protein